jgi:orotate phosphoribosyltransferase-like protein
MNTACSQRPASAEGVGVRLADDLARSGSHLTHAVSETAEMSGFATASRPIADKSGSHARRAESEKF